MIIFKKKYTRQEFIELLSTEKHKLLIQRDNLKYEIENLEEILRIKKNGPILDPCDINDYRRWLEGFAKKGGEATHQYGYPWNRIEWKIATINDIELSPLFGSNSYNLIVEKGIKATGKPGHINIFYMDDFTHNGFVPEYEDIQISMFE